MGFPSPGSGRAEDDGYILLSAPAKLCVPGVLPSTGQPGRQHPGKRGGVTRVSCFLDSERLPFVVLNYAAGKKRGVGRGSLLCGRGHSFSSRFFI